LSAALVEVALAAGRMDLARAGSEELLQAATRYRSAGLEATSLQCEGAVLLAAGRAGESLPLLRTACLRWQQLNAPYAAARVRVLLAAAYYGLGDRDSARLERDAARQVFKSLKALDDLRTLDGAGPQPSLPGGLTDREAEVLLLVSRGQTNRQVANSLFLSEKTVARHLSNIYAKLGVASRTEAARFAIEHGMGRTSQSAPA
jgi:DNA-binding CsgD family transcriptional regulator